MSAVDELIELLKNVQNSLKSRREIVPNSLLTLLAYCNDYIIKNKFEIRRFNAYFEQSRVELVRLSQGGYIWFDIDKERELEKFDKLGERIRENPKERKSDKQGRFRKLIGLLRRKKTVHKKIKLPEPKKEPSGLEKYKTWCDTLLREFEAKFNPTNPDTSKREYQIAKRIYRIIQCPLFEFVYSGAFESEGSQLSGGHWERRKRILQFLADQSQELIKAIDRCLSEIKHLLSVDALLLVQTEIISLSRGMEGRPNERPMFRFYIRQLQETIYQSHELLIPVADIHSAQSIMLPEDLRKIRSIYQSLILDRSLWQAFYETCISGDERVYNLTAIDDYNYIRFETIGKICDTYERTFSIDHLSESDKGIAFIMGTSSEEPEAIFEQPEAETVPKGFSDPRGYFSELGIKPEDLGDKSENEIKKILKHRYYDSAKRYHPDLHPGDRIKAERFKKISEAYGVLSDVSKRNRYLKNLTI